MEYNFEKFVPAVGNRTQGYRGICVGKTQISLSSHCRKALRSIEWTHIAVFFDKEKGVIKFTPAIESTGYKIYGQMSIQISQYMPTGRYERIEDDGSDALLFQHEKTPPTC